MDLQDGSGSETSEQSLQKLQSETDILAVTGASCLLCYSRTMHCVTRTVLTHDVMYPDFFFENLLRQPYIQM